MVTEQGVMITTGGVVVSALITQTPAIIREIKGTPRIEEDRKLATEALEAKTKEIEALRTVCNEIELQLVGERRRNELLKAEVEWLRTQCPHVFYQGAKQ